MHVLVIAALAVVPACNDDIRQAGVLLQQSAPARALAVLEPAAGRCSQSAEFFDVLGIAQDMSGRAAEAQEAFRRAAGLKPRWARPLINLAVSLLRTGEETGAVEALEKAVSIDPTNTTANADLGAYWARKGEFRRALPFFEAMGGERSPVVRKDPALRLSLIECLLGAGREQSALAAAPAPEESQPAAFRFALGVVLARHAQYRAAIRQFQAIPRGEADSAVMFNEGLAHSRLREFNQARECYFAAIDRDPNHVEAYFRIGLDFASAGQNRKAIPWLFRANRMQPDRPDIVAALTGELAAAQYHQTADAILDAAMRTHPASGILSAAKGECLLAEAKNVEAESWFRRALDQDRALTGASVGLARALAAQQRTAEARELLRQVLAKEPANLAANTAAGRMANEAGDWNNAVAYLANANSADPENVQTAVALAHAYQKCGQPARALTVLTGLRERAGQNRSFHYELAQTFRALSRREDAEREMAEVRSIDMANQEGFHFASPAMYIH